MAQIAHKVSSMVVRERIAASPEQIAAFCRAHHIRWLALFGSGLRDDFRDDSDVDVLVEFEPNHPVTFLDLHTMEEELSILIRGRKIDIATAASLHRLIRARPFARRGALCREMSGSTSPICSMRPSKHKAISRGKVTTITRPIGACAVNWDTMTLAIPTLITELEKIVPLEMRAES